MPRGDWHPESTIHPTIWNVQHGDEGAAYHVGVSYHILSPNGKVLATRAFTWDIPADHKKAIEEILAQGVAELLSEEGLTKVSYPHFDPPLPVHPSQPPLP